MITILALCDPMDCSPPGSSVHGILQARILEWVAISSSSFPAVGSPVTWILCFCLTYVLVGTVEHIHQYLPQKG